jgi:hypothetical protein
MARMLVKAVQLIEGVSQAKLEVAEMFQTIW